MLTVYRKRASFSSGSWGLKVSGFHRLPGPSRCDAPVCGSAANRARPLPADGRSTAAQGSRKTWGLGQPVATADLGASLRVSGFHRLPGSPRYDAPVCGSAANPARPLPADGRTIAAQGWRKNVGLGRPVATAISGFALHSSGCLRLELQQPIYRPLGLSNCFFPCRARRDLFAPIRL